jgi:hypothetical protein
MHRHILSLKSIVSFKTRSFLLQSQISFFEVLCTDAQAIGSEVIAMNMGSMSMSPLSATTAAVARGSGMSGMSMGGMGEGMSSACQVSVWLLSLHCYTH